ncbi:MAG: hypothetical protein ACPGJS_19400 [Flammeovirgaceae bacterium]
MTLARTLESFQGLVLTEIEPSFPHLIFGEQLSLKIDCPWRVLHANYIVAGNVDYRIASRHAALLAEMEEYLIGQAIIQIKIDEVLGDIRIYLGELTQIQLFPTSATYEAWQLKWSDGSISGGLNGEIEFVHAKPTNP